MLLQWGQKKRARVSRSEIRALADESLSSGQARQQPAATQFPRRLDDAKLPAPSLRKESAALLLHRNLEKRSAAGNGSPSRASGGGGCGSRVVCRSTTAGKRFPPTPDKVDKKAQQQPTTRSARDEKLHHHHHQAAAATVLLHRHHHDHGCHAESTSVQFDHKAASNNNTAVERLVVEWPRIFLSLSRKEKEDDFLVMKGTKLPQRPKKRAKNVDRSLEYCFPGMWLPDLTKSRYEVREKKSVKKKQQQQQQKRRGLKGMDSESE